MKLPFDPWDFLYSIGIIALFMGAWSKWGPGVAGIISGAVLIATALIGSGIVRLEGKVKRGNIDSSST
jgi:hypothetical protein